MSLTPEGFFRPRLTEIKADYDQRFIDALGPVNTAPDSVTGQIIGIFSAALDDVYEALQNTYDSMYPATAEGAALDGAVSFVGLERIGAAATSVVAVAYGAESTLIPAGSLARSVDNRAYSSTFDTVISRANAVDVEITINSVQNSATYQVIAGGVSVLYLSDATATADEIASGLAALFNPAAYIATATNGVLKLRSFSGATGFALTVDSKLTISKLGSPVVFSALTVGAHVLPVGSLTTIDSATSGWLSLNNLAAGATGRDIETDEELRIRHREGVRATGTATAKAIQARLRAEVASVTAVAVYENRTNVTDTNGLPPHSFETVVSGGTDTDVAAKIYEVAPAGIQTHGNTSVLVSDVNGDGQQIKFTRPVGKFAWVQVTVTLLNPEEPLSTGAVAAIKNAVVAYGSSLGVGKDIITQRFVGPVYAVTTGIGAITVEADVNDLLTDPVVYSSSNIVIGLGEMALFDISRVVVVGI